MVAAAPVFRDVLTPRQACAVTIYARTRSQAATARRMRISQPAVSQLLFAASTALAKRAGKPVSIVDLVRAGVTRRDAVMS